MQELLSALIGKVALMIVKMWQKVKKFLRVAFLTKMVLILDDHTVRLFVNDEIVPIQIVYSSESLLEHPEGFLQKLTNELKQIRKTKAEFSLVRPVFLVILKGKPEAVNSEIIVNIIDNGVQCLELFIMRWSKAEGHLGKNLEEVCREFPRWLKDWQFVKNIQTWIISSRSLR